MNKQLQPKYVSIRCGWPDFVTRKTKPKKVASFSRLKGENEVDFRPEAKVAKSDKPFGGVRFQNKLEKAREDVRSRRAARNRIKTFIKATV
jgi:hypothetical protein